MKFLNKKKFRRIYWQIMLRVPPFLREKLVRARFKVNYDIDPSFQFKQAETKEEIEAALNMVYEAYLGLNYIDQNVQSLHFTKFLGLPSTIILVIKQEDQVVGTMSIVMDSTLGLPCDTTWNLDEVRKRGRIAEISALCLKKELKNKNLLLPLIKFAVYLCNDFLKLDAAIMAATHEVEPFYTDLILFKKINNVTGQEHSLVKGNESTCCYLPLGKDFEERCEKLYGKKNLDKNLYHYFFKYDCPNLKLPKETDIFSSKIQDKNKNLFQLFTEKPLKIKNG